MATIAASIEPLGFDARKVPIVVTSAVQQVHVINTVDDVLLCRLRTSPTAPLISYPATPRGKTDYMDYSADDLNRFVDEAVRKYASSGLIPEVKYLEVFKGQPADSCCTECVVDRSRNSSHIGTFKSRLRCHDFRSLAHVVFGSVSVEPPFD